MRRILVFAGLAAACIVACTKKTTIVMTEPKPAFIVSGLTDVTLVNGTSSFGYYGVSVPITVQYNDSDQQMVTLSLSSLPPGITMDTTWRTKGYPTFTATLNMYDTTAAGATPGTYPMVLTAKTSTETKTYPFNIIVRNPPSCTAGITGKYYSCYGCPSGSYADSVYNDPNIANKIWLTNINNSGGKIYAILTCSSMSLQVPSQTVGGVTYYGNGYASAGHQITLSLVKSGSSCYINMN